MVLPNVSATLQAYYVGHPRSLRGCHKHFFYADAARRNAAAALHAKGQLVVFKASLADSLPDHLAADDDDAGDGDGERSDLVVLQLCYEPNPATIILRYYRYFICHLTMCSVSANNQKPDESTRKA